MIASKRELILRELEDGTGAAIGTSIDKQGLRAGLKIWFDDLDEKHGPVAEVRPHGLKGHRVELTFGDFSRQVLAQIRQASVEDVQLARALIASIRPPVEVTVENQNLSDWTVQDGRFRITGVVRYQSRSDDDASIIATCRDAIVPMMAAMAELIGYDIIESESEPEVPAYEGALLQSLVRRRERNPRNRLLCIRIHGEKCVACGMDPHALYGEAGGIIEVHHLEPLARIAAPRPYDPQTDLVPLCPSCHRAVHTRHPVPFDIDELQSLMRGCRE